MSKKLNQAQTTIHQGINHLTVYIFNTRRGPFFNSGYHGSEIGLFQKLLLMSKRGYNGLLLNGIGGPGNM